MSNKNRNETNNDFYGDWEREPRSSKPNSRIRRQARQMKQGVLTEGRKNRTKDRHAEDMGEEAY